MAYTTTTTSITSATSSRSKQATVYQYPTGNGVVITGASVNSNTTAYLGVTTPGAAQTYTAVSGGATITEIVYLDSDNVPTNANAVSTTGGNIKIVGTGFASGSKVYINNALVTNTVPNSTAIIATLTTGSVGNVSCYIFGSGNSGGAISANSVRFSGAPSWVTAAAVSSVNGIASNIALQASGDGTLTYVLKSGSGSLPTGITLLSSGYLTGTATGYSADTVVTFTLIVRDTENQATQQTFNYTVFIGDTYFKQTSLLLSATVSNTFISDSSTNNFLITRNGDTRPSRLSPYWPGGWSGYFDGTGDYLSLATNGAFDYGTGNFTIECWFYIAGNSATNNSSHKAAALFSTYPASSTLNGYALEIGGNASTTGTGLSFASWVSGSSAVVQNNSLTITQNAWHHVAVVRNGTSTTIYYDGSNVASGALSNQNVNTSGNTLKIGTMGYAGYIQDFVGYISNARIIKGTALYTANFTPATTSLTTVANTSLLTLRDAILADDSPNNFTITRIGDTRLTSFSPFNTAPHTVTANTNSVYFDGTGDYLTVAANAAFNMGAASNNFTMECWVYQTANSGTRGLFGPRPSTNSGYDGGYGFYIQDGVPTFQVFTFGAFAADTATGPTIPLNTWAHIAGVRNNSQIRVYVNGVGGTAVSTTRNGDNSSPFYIGSYQGSDYLFTGYISNVRVLKGVAQYTANFTPATSALTAISGTSLLACQANTIIDSNTTPKTITVNGNPNVSLSNPFGETVTTISNYSWTANSYGASAYFDGTGDYLNVGSNAAFAFGTGAYTIECWVYPTALNIAVFVGIRATGGLQLFYDTTSGVGLSNVGSPGFLFAGTLSLNQWYHLAAVRSSTASNDTRIYINGALRAIGTDSTNWTVNGPLIIAANQNGTETFTGYMTDVRWTKGTALYTTSFVPPAAPVSNVANVSLLTLQSDIGSNSAQFVDQSPNNHLITRNGNASQGTFGPLVPSTWSAYFDGTGDYLSIPTNAAFTLGAGDFTIEIWFYAASITNTYGRTIAATYSFVSSLNRGWILNLSSTGYPQFELYNSSGVQQFAILSSVIAPTNQWAHLAAVRSSSSVKLYLNGTQVGSATSSADDTVQISDFTIGTHRSDNLTPATGNSGTSFLGYISNLRIVKGTALYTANFTPSTTTIGPIANTSLLTVRGPSFTDDSGNNFTITRNGDTKIVPFGPFSPQTVTPDSYSYRFSNASDYISTTSSNLAFGSNNWTIESWVYPRFTANSGVFQVSNVQYGLTNSNLNTVALGFSNSNKAIVRVANATYTSTGTSITANAWTHLALVKSSNVSKLYINGTLDSTIGTSGSITDTVSYTGTTNVAVGGYGSTSALANAYISNFRVVSNSAVYTENFTPAVGPLSAISGTTLLTCQANTVLDSSAANLTITANANVSPSSFNPFDETVTVGQQYSALADGGSVYFDGDGDYLRLTAAVLGSGNFSIEFWVYPIELRSNAAYFDQTSGFLFRQDTANILVYDRTTNLTILTTSGNLCKAFHWNHIAVVRASGIITVYINGINAGSASNTTNFNATDTYIGAFINNQTTGSIYGYLANFRILNGTALYTANFVPPAAPALPTVANTSLLLNFTSSGVIDSTGRNVLETVADAKVTTNLKKYGTGSYYFDGTGDYLLVTSNSTELAFGAGDFTVEFWFYPTTSGVGEIMYDHRPAGTNGAYLVIYKQSTNVIAIYVNTAARITGTTALAANTWYHIACSRSGTSTKLFLNGTQEGSTYTDSNSYLNATNRPVIATDGSSVGSTMVNGYIADLRVTKGYARYTANFTVPSEPFITK